MYYYRRYVQYTTKAVFMQVKDYKKTGPDTRRDRLIFKSGHKSFDGTRDKDYSIGMKRCHVLKITSILFAATLASGCVANCSHTKEAETTEAVVQEIPEQEIKAAEAEPVQVAETTKPAPKPEPKKEEPKPEPKKEEPKATEVSFTTPKPDPKPEPKKEEPKVAEKKEEPKKEEPKPAPKKEAAVTEEYERSVAQMAAGQTIDVETFNKDKEAVLALINELNSVMKEQNYKVWLNYLDEESKIYWSNKTNLKKAQKRLPVKGLTLSTLEDYFKYIFIPSRQGNEMDEIRYETESSVKAVQIRTDEKGRYAGDTVYYYLRKVKGEWKLHLPQM